MINPHKDKVEDTDENRLICRKYCKVCPNYKRHSLEKYQPAELFCACGKSSAPTIKEVGSFCFACELFSKHHLNLGYFCVK
jgi:ribosomal protein L44E